MNRVEKIYRMRRSVLVVAFVCSIFLFCWYNLPGLLLKGGVLGLLKFSDRLPVSFFAIAGLMTALLLAILFVRYLLFRASTFKDPLLRRAVDDERVRQNWLKAYRSAFLILVGIHLTYLFLGMGLIFELGFSHVAWFSLTSGLMALFGAALFHTREVKNERLR